MTCFVSNQKAARHLPRPPEWLFLKRRRELGTDRDLAPKQKALAQDAATGTKLSPAPELPGSTPIERVEFPTRIRNALNSAGTISIGDVREASDALLLSLPDLGSGSVAFLRERLGPPSTEGRALPGAKE